MKTNRWLVVGLGVFAVLFVGGMADARDLGGYLEAAQLASVSSPLNGVTASALAMTASAEKAYSGCTVTVNFDSTIAPASFTSTSRLTTAFSSSGVVFSGPTGNNGGAVLNVTSGWGVTGYSSPNALAFDSSATLSDSGVPQGPETITLASPVVQVSAHVATDNTPNSSMTLTATAFDSSSTEVDAVTVPLTNAMQSVVVTAAAIDHVVYTPSSSVVRWLMDDVCVLVSATEGEEGEGTVEGTIEGEGTVEGEGEITAQTYAWWQYLLAWATLLIPVGILQFIHGGVGGSGGDPCFIATAAYGTPMAPQLDTLRMFRDTFLLDHRVGVAFVDLYYRISPPIADLVATSPFLAAMVRVVLAPVIWGVRAFLAAPGLVTVMVSLVFARLGWLLRRKTRRN